MLALILASCAVKAEEIKVGEFFREYDAADSDTKQRIEQLVSKLENGFIWANAHLEEVRKEPRIYCQPDRLVLTGSQIIEMLRHEMKQNPASEIYPIGFGFLEMYRATFPCGGSSKDSSGVKDPSRFKN